MGCYMSSPDDDVFIVEGKGKHFKYATASCQGWRREQEDAEDCIPYFDDDASLFVLCDGHGGAEVAQYTVKHLPDFIKNHPLYKQGKYGEALKSAFIEFDALLRTDAVAAELKRIAFDEQRKKGIIDYKDSGDKMEVKEEAEGKVDEQPHAQPSSASTSYDAEPSCSSACPSAGSSSGVDPFRGAPSTVAEDVDAETLRKEAQVPIAELISKYSDQPSFRAGVASLRSMPTSRPRVEGDKDENGNGNEVEQEKKTDNDSKQPETSEPSNEPSSSKHVDDGPSSSSSSDAISAGDYKAALLKAMEKYFDGDDVDSEDDSEFEGQDSSDEDDDDDDDDDDEDDDDEGDEDEESDDEDDDGDDERDEELGDWNKSKRFKPKKQRRPANPNPEDSTDDDTDQDDDNEEDDNDNEEDDNDSNDDEENLPGGRPSGYDRELDEYNQLVEIYENNCEEFKQAQKLRNRIHTPGMDSGCTVVVALAKNGKLYVASAGDSRCIMIMRDGSFKPLSFDHKPEDAIENTRIIKAGGRVTEGRVNGGLNLSRAFGDFTYKDINLKAEDQMITPCPDVISANLDPNQVEYIFLACDGIWNSMKNQQVTKFIRKTAPTVDHNLVEICLRLFQHCIAPGTYGDGTGCDNMTCILARYESSKDVSDSTATKSSDLQATTTSVQNQETNATTETVKLTDPTSLKRRAEDDSKPDNSVKRRCLQLRNIPKT